MVWSVKTDSLFPNIAKRKKFPNTKICMTVNQIRQCINYSACCCDFFLVSQRTSVKQAVLQHVWAQTGWRMWSNVVWVIWSQMRPPWGMFTPVVRAVPPLAMVSLRIDVYTRSEQRNLQCDKIWTFSLRWWMECSWVKSTLFQILQYSKSANLALYVRENNTCTVEGKDTYNRETKKVREAEK